MRRGGARRHPDRSAPASARDSPWGQDTSVRLRFWLMQQWRARVQHRGRAASGRAIWVQKSMASNPLSSAQIRAARALLRWSAADLARESALGVNTIRRAEVAEGGTSLTAANQLAVRRA